MENTRGQASGSKNFTAFKRALQAFQSDRIDRTYADLKEDSEYSRIAEFFFEKLYAPKDFTVRDATMFKLQNLLEGRVYKGVVKAMYRVVELHELTEELDNLMVRHMMENGMDTDFTLKQYSATYKALDNYNERLYQIDLTLEVARTFYHLSRKWIVALSLKTVRSAAHLIGAGKILDFIYQGYEGFRAIPDIEYFLKIVRERETAWHNKIWEYRSGKF